MHIFNKQIFGSDAIEWLEKSVNQKVEWIKKHTNQQNDDIINEFLSNLSIYKDGDKNCLNCGNNANISKRIPKEIETVIEPTPKKSRKYRDNK